MRDSRLPSLTALVVACARGVANVSAGSKAPVDAIADRLVPAPIGALMRAAQRAAGRSVHLDRALRAGSLGLVDHVTLRTAAIDAVVVSCAERVAQLVILGAGLDARAWRMPQLAAATVFEIDHPSTQAYKRARTAGARSRARKVTFVGVDFERDDLGVRLAASGHDSALPTMWIWEGVTPYLTPEALAGTLDVIGERSSPGSVLAMTYGTPDLVDGFRLLHPLVRPAFRLLGEPLEGLIETSAAMRLLRARGFEVEDDSGAPDWAARVGARRPPVVVAERLLVAEVRASSGRASPGRC